MKNIFYKLLLSACILFNTQNALAANNASYMFSVFGISVATLAATVFKKSSAHFNNAINFVTDPRNVNNIRPNISNFDFIMARNFTIVTLSTCALIVLGSFNKILSGGK
ncbi:hypothetical protein M1446_00315 [Candidatus Dependentiae bacterium]|nr:hypothetical protein [Candidatus Dependentiae bacterium]